MYEYIKRLMDLIIALLALPLLFVLILILGPLIYMEDRGPVFYKSARIGRNGKRLDMLKFRSMKVNAPDLRNVDGSTFNSRQDARVTKIGRFMRETSIDETAQLLNVLIGDMSLIGPRASTWDQLDTYKQDEIDKLKVRPGITGYTQAYFRNDLSAREKRLKDAWYANNMCFSLDVKIFFKTIKTVLLRKNLYTN